MTTYIELGPCGAGGGGGGGSDFWGDAVANFAALPAGSFTGECRLTIDTQVIYTWTGAAWEIANTEIATVAHTDTDSIDLSSPGDVLNADLNISADAATAGSFKATTTVKSGANKGIHVEIPEAATAQDGILTQADWNTFNGKQDDLPAGTANDYLRGDETFQQLNIAALKIDTTSTINTTAVVLGQVEATQTETATGVAASGTWGDVVSLNVPAGYWLITGMVMYNHNGADMTGSVKAGISDSLTGVGISDFDMIEMPFINTGGELVKMALSSVIVGVGTTTGYFLNTNFSYTSGTPSHGGRIRAIRLK